MDKLKSRPLLVVSCAVSALLVVGVLTFAGPCVHEDGSASTCFTASRAILAAGLIGVVCSLAGLLVRNAKPSGAFALAVFCSGAFAGASAGLLFPLCMMLSMRCWTMMRPFALVCGALMCLCGIVSAVKQFVPKQDAL